ncbi:hypothetical protein ACFYTG_38705 [Streptomyces mirabilis]|uniref:hypothetical protein n=1 Tax=Streptomyces mirabilis TaxID=68239 RepID=UPI003677CB50
MTVFAGTSAHYRRFRPGIPVALAAFPDQTAPTDRPRRLLDVGTGPGLVVQALLPYFDDPIAVDAEPGALLRPGLDAAPSDQAVLGASDFSLVTSTVFPIRRQWTVAQVIGYLHSTPFAAPYLFGDCRSAFEVAVTDALAPLIDGGALSEDNAFTVHTARRPPHMRTGDGDE